MSSPIVYVVTGAGRGLGLQIVKTLSTRPDTIVFAGVRSWPLDSEDQLTKLAAVSPNVVFPIKLTSADEMDNLAAASVVKDKVGKVDVIVANAGTSTGITPLSTVKPAQMRSDFETNTIGPVVLFQAFAPLLSSSDAPGGAKFVIISAILGQIEDSLPYQYNAYGISKAGANYIAKKLNQTIPDLISFPIHPGMVDTDMGRQGVASLGMSIEEVGGITAEASVTGLLAVIDVATKATHGGKFWNYTGERLTF